ncbi:hypothetical protein ACFVZC_24525 [Streptomyces marokkonensis]|uniref:Regulator of chromosome condensation (RCC1) repeat-containing protein n=1 Tax=Streptomyces marokkonensis TaxID=324855 RepID=A0ABW6QBZ3_9ACTN
MARKSWLRVLVAGAAVLGAAGCGEADRAVLGTPRCPDGPPARPTPRQAQPGFARAWFPMAGAPAGGIQAGPVPGWTDVVSVADGRCTTVAVRADGTVWSYGTNVGGSLGQGHTERHYRAEPRQVPGIDDAREVHGSGPTCLGGRAGAGAARPVRIPLPGPALDLSGRHVILEPAPSADATGRGPFQDATSESSRHD